ncbi:hypothetical protein KC332_g14731 [Hortaea werneckii]|nr:hypothetical protein KC358_g13612 [Hortaea werneckii]KAI6808309.1 hypothetical protein KC350_g13389 [Hortaea werneckii]KAI6909076.1 hypothetical protein KC348_g13618 [Hortaea werneckii]KAI6925609.1 hypothetical protein KC341_g13291 [Hortaea werneckii]KAI6959488.1 hypothetical protein KC321_g13394 [Hortaea werneckii]
MSGYYDKKLGYYTIVEGVSSQDLGLHRLGFHLHLSTRGDLLDHLHGFADSIDDVVSKWSGEPAFNHLTANDIREGIEAIQSRSHPNFAQDDGANLNGNERAATIEQLYGVAKLAAAISHKGEQDVQNTKTSLWALRADIDRLHATQTNLTASLAPLQNDTHALKAFARLLNHRRHAADAVSNTLATQTARLEHNLAHTTAELTRSQTVITELQRALHNMAQQIDLLDTIARQNADVTEAKNQRIEELIQAAARDRGNLVELKDLLRMAREEKREGRRRRVVRSFERVFSDFLDGEVYVEMEEDEGEGKEKEEL